MSGILEKYFLINVNSSTSWDIKRDILYKKITNIFKNVEQENTSFMKKYLLTKEKTKIIKILEMNISDKFFEMYYFFFIILVKNFTHQIIA